MDSKPSVSVPQLLRRRTALVGLVVVLAVSCSGDADTPAEGMSEGVSGSPEAESVGSGTGDLKFGGYTEDEIGTEILVDDRLAGLHILARYRTYEDHRLASAAESDLSSMSPSARDRAYFEQAVSLLLLGADDAMPAEVSDAHKELWDAFYRSLDLCVERSAWPEVKLYEILSDGYVSGSYRQFESAQQLYGMTLDEYIDFEHECHKFAASYPSLDREYRDELLNTRRDYYLEVLRLWMRDNPEMVVPMTYEQSVNHPYQDYVREICRATDDPEECARHEGVSYP
jgi:hypothetical protein